jgi:phosphonate transport system substrate-binding protein
MRSYLIALVVLSFSLFAHAAPQQITIGSIPSKDPELMKTQLLEFGKLLQDKLHIPIQIYVSKDYAGLMEAMKNKKVDFAFFSASTFVFAEKNAKAKVLLKKVWDSPFYHSAIVVRADSGISSIEKLKGKKLAFVDEKSGSGYLQPQVLFKKKGIDYKTFFKETVFSGNHANSVALLADKKVDAIATYANDKSGKSGAWNVADLPTASPKVKALWVSEPIPNDPFCVRQDFYDTYPRVAHDVMFGIIELFEDKQTAPKMKEALAVSGMMLATSQQYEPVREMVRELNIQLQ